MTDHSSVRHLRQVKIELYLALLDCDPDYLLSEAGSHNLNMISTLNADKDIREIFKSSPNKQVETPDQSTTG